ncbi:MAG TPA: ATP-binding protein, partial [Roseateles sp.]
RQRAALGVQGAVDLRRPRAQLADVVLLDAAAQALARALRLHAADPGHGLRLLLAGPPGTGKTLAAEALAHELQRDLLVVDAGRVWSKWLGETERNLETAFEAAEASGALLFIDEADALFARRTEIKDAHDRYANAGTAFLLQRLERFTGVLVLASNARGSLDPAFTRRFDAVIPFDEPDEAARALLWARHLDAARSAPLAPPEACALLARWYPLTGAQIRAAARAAPAEAGPGGLDAVLNAIAREFHKLGRAFPGRPQPELPSCPR